MSLALILLIQASALAALPDNRGYEMVSPVEKGGLSFLSNLTVTDAAGEHVVVSGGAKNAQLSNGMSWMLETRSPAGWSGVPIGPAPTANADFKEEAQTTFNAVSEDFSTFAFGTRMPLDPRSTTHGTSEYVRTGSTGPFSWITGPPAPALPVSEPGECNGGLAPESCPTNRAVFAGASNYLKDLVWGQYHPLLAPPAALSGYPPDTHEHGYEVYESVSGVDQLVGLVPSAGTEHECGPSHGPCVAPPCGAAMGNEGGEVTEVGLTAIGFAPVAGAVSGDGSQVVFTSPDPVPYHEGMPGCTPPEIYIRANGTTSVQVSASAKAGGDPSGPQEKKYAGSSEEDGHIDTIFFTSKEELTENANTGGADEGDDLYAYSVATGGLTDLTPENNTPAKKFNEFGEEYEAVEAILLGSSTNGTLVYFIASSELTAAPNSHGQTAIPGQSNLYVYDETTGHTTFIAPGAGLAAPHQGLAYGPSREGPLTSEVTPDGEYMVFVSTERLTEYDNFGSECDGKESSGQPKREPGPCGEVYRYTAAGKGLVCVSCDPSGAPPVGGARLPGRFVEGYLDGSLEPGTLPLPKAITDDGSRVFFSSPDQLTVDSPQPATTNGSLAPLASNWEFEPNVFEFEDGDVHLIAPRAVLTGTTPSGRDVFLDTYSQLTPQDTDDSPDIYDARVVGGFPVLTPPACSGTSCQGTPAPLTIFATPPSTTFTGVGNFPAPSSAPAKLKTAAQIRAEKLAKALRICRSKHSHMKRFRTSCEKNAQKRYGPVKKKIKAGRAGNNGRAGR